MEVIEPVSGSGGEMGNAGRYGKGTGGWKLENRIFESL